MLNLTAVPSVNLYCRVHVHVHLKDWTKSKYGQIIDGSRDAHYKLLFDDSAFPFNQMEKKLCQLLGTCTLIDMSAKL